MRKFRLTSIVVLVFILCIYLLRWLNHVGYSEEYRYSDGENPYFLSVEASKPIHPAGDLTSHLKNNQFLNQSRSLAEKDITEATTNGLPADRIWGETVFKNSNGFLDLYVFENGVCQIKMASNFGKLYTKKTEDLFTPVPQTNWPNGVSIKFRKISNGELLLAGGLLGIEWHNPSREIPTRTFHDAPLVDADWDTGGLDLVMLTQMLESRFSGKLKNLSEIEFKLSVWASGLKFFDATGSSVPTHRSENFESDWLNGRYLKVK